MHLQIYVYSATNDKALQTALCVYWLRCEARLVHLIPQRCCSFPLWDEQTGWPSSHAAAERAMIQRNGRRTVTLPMLRRMAVYMEFLLNGSSLSWVVLGCGSSMLGWVSSAAADWEQSVVFFSQKMHRNIKSKVKLKPEIASMGSTCMSRIWVIFHHHLLGWQIDLGFQLPFSICRKQYGGPFLLIKVLHTAKKGISRLCVWRQTDNNAEVQYFAPTSYPESPYKVSWGEE